MAGLEGRNISYKGVACCSYSRYLSEESKNDSAIKSFEELFQFPYRQLLNGMRRTAYPTEVPKPFSRNTFFFLP